MRKPLGYRIAAARRVADTMGHGGSIEDCMASAPRPETESDPAWHGVEPRGGDLREQDPYPALHHLRTVAPVNETPEGFWRLSRYADCVRMLRDVPCGVRQRDGRAPGRRREDPQEGALFMLEADPPTHTRLRKLVSKAFTPRAAESWRARTQAITDALLDRALAGGDVEIDLIADLALPVPSTVICEMLGVPVADRDRFTTWTADATHALADDRMTPEQARRAEAGTSELAAYFNALIAERRSDLTDDLLSVLIRAEEDGDRLTPGELLVQSIGLLIAGFETTIGLIGNGLNALLHHPDELAKLRQRPELVATAVEECLRFDGPIPATVRVTHADVEFDGRTIPPDTLVWVMLASANRDPERFPDPDRFDIERADNAHLAFGGGTHLCLGAHLARMEAQVAIGTMARRTRSLEPLYDRIEWGRSLFRVPGRLPVRAKSA